MPCQSDYCGEIEAERELNRVTNLLCKLCGECDKAKLQLPFDVEVWWKRHKKYDEQRKREVAESLRKDVLRAKALKKLTLEERAALKL
jgi:hypothetical protein